MSNFVRRSAQRPFGLDFSKKTQAALSFFYRQESTLVAGKSELGPVKDDYFIPGRRGYSPEFEPPKGWTRAPKPKKGLQNPSDILPPSKDQLKELDPTKASPKAIYKQQLKKIRYQYYKEHVENAFQKDIVVKQKFEKIMLKEKQKVQEKAQQTKEYIKNIVKDPFSSYNVMNHEGTSLLGSIDSEDSKIQSEEFNQTEINNEIKAQETIAEPSVEVKDEIKVQETIAKPSVETNDEIKAQEPIDKNINQDTENNILLKPYKDLDPPKIQVFYPIEENRIAQEIRKNRRLEMIKNLKHERLCKLTELFHSTSTFVTFENLDEKIENFFEGIPVYFSGWDNLINMDSEGKLLPQFYDIQDRQNSLRNELEGTAGPDGQISFEKVMEYYNQKKSSAPETTQE
ncbi:hypothetical protein BB561_004681 [Smittium simulii]|uniref:Uncharacterized protein n=1 Tax=Smittium simulii TaxID=133385 RepID=A0A2T9YEV4_9FUNG|nr:hypothetical protein BB561_004681 [Smittium simulii]